MIFSPAELALLRASDRVVDQMEPGGCLERMDRAARRASGEVVRRGRPAKAIRCTRIRFEAA